MIDSVTTGGGGDTGVSLAIGGVFCACLFGVALREGSTGLSGSPSLGSLRLERVSRLPPVPTGRPLGLWPACALGDLGFLGDGGSSQLAPSSFIVSGGRKVHYLEYYD